MDDIASYPQLPGVDNQSCSKLQPSLSSPISLLFTLPEIITEIFLLGIEDFPLGPRESLPFEILISHVSGLWRQVALGTPTLWTKIRRQRRHSNLEAIEEYLKRSKANPIDINIRIFGEPDNIKSLCHLTQPHLSRCQRLDIHSSNEREDLKILQMLGQPDFSMPLLMTLKLNLRSSFESKLLIQGGAPLLENLYLIGGTTNAPTSTFKNLKVLHYDLTGAFRHHWHRPLDALNDMSYLTHLQLNIRDTLTRWPPAVPTITIESLHTLCIEAYSVLDILEVLKHFNAVALQEIGVHLTGDLHEDVPAVDVLAQFPLLRKLCLRLPAGGVSLSSMHLLVQAYPALTHITVRAQPLNLWFSSRNPPNPFCMLAASSPYNGHTPWPQLDTLGMDGDCPLVDLQTFFAERGDMGHHVPHLLLSADITELGQTAASSAKLPITIGSLSYDSPFLQEDLI